MNNSTSTGLLPLRDGAFSGVAGKHTNPRSRIPSLAPDGGIDSASSTLFTVPEIMTKEEVAVLLRVSTRTIDRLHEKKTAPKRFRLPGMTHYRYKRSDVLAWIDSL